MTRSTSQTEIQRTNSSLEHLPEYCSYANPLHAITLISVIPRTMVPFEQNGFDMQSQRVIKAMEALEKNMIMNRYAKSALRAMLDNIK